MIQISQSDWQVRTETGVLMQKNVTVSSVHDATEFIKRYVSSFMGWEYEVIPMNKEVKK